MYHQPNYSLAPSVGKENRTGSKKVIQRWVLRVEQLCVISGNGSEEAKGSLDIR